MNICLYNPFIETTLDKQAQWYSALVISVSYPYIQLIAHEITRQCCLSNIKNTTRNVLGIKNMKPTIITFNINQHNFRFIIWLYTSLEVSSKRDKRKHRKLVSSSNCSISSNGEWKLSSHPLTATAALTDIHNLPLTDLISCKVHTLAVFNSWCVDLPCIGMRGISHLIRCYIYTECKALRHASRKGDENLTVPFLETHVTRVHAGMQATLFLRIVCMRGCCGVCGHSEGH